LVEFSSVSTISWSCYGVLWPWIICFQRVFLGDNMLSEFFFEANYPPL
jgi:hypothetical protein